jgi:hypothetical protein
MSPSNSLSKIIGAFAEAAARGDFARAEGWLAVALLAAGRGPCEDKESSAPRCGNGLILGPPAGPRSDTDGIRR